ncbi:MAG: hypothetical protein LBV45_11155 [Xanthomonadaceae bacterium]|nr:hypothetical protein [Xanthomonadaceae bacterium]
MEILEAYCEELHRVIGIYEAQEEYFSQPIGQRSRFTFRCSDAACRATNHPLVVGANYHKNAEDSEKYQQPHFRSHPNHPHIDACMWVTLEVERQKATSDPTSGSAKSKATNAVDIFEPRNADTSRSSAATTIIDLSKTTSSDAAEQGGIRTVEHTGISTTSLLEKLIDCWSNMEHQDRLSHRITINDRTITYYQLCLHINKLTEDKNGARVIYGGARVQKWPANTEARYYYVNFFDGCDRFPDTSGEKSLTISLPIKRLKNSRRGALLINRLEQALQANHYLQVYAWGNVTAHPNGKGYVLNLAALDNLVLKAIKKKQVGQ